MVFFYKFFQFPRRRGLASALVDAFRRNVIAFTQLGMGDLAFSDPTPGGVVFARAYTGRRDFLVYSHSQ